MEMRTYRQVFSIAEFRALFIATGTQSVSMTVQTLALSVLVYSRTGSPLLATLAYVGGYVPQAFGVMTVSSLADRIPPRRILVACDLLRAAVFALLGSNVLPVGGMLASVMAASVIFGAFGGVRWALLTAVLPVDAYVLGRSLLNAANGAMQIVGFGIGGVLLAMTGATGTLWVAVALALVTASINRWGLAARPARGESRGLASVRATWAGNRALMSDRRTRRVMLAQWIPNGLIVGAEALYVPYAGKQAAVLLVAAGLGMLVGDLALGRWVSAQSTSRLTAPLYLLLALPYLAFVAHPSVPVATALIVVASIGYAGTLGVQQMMVSSVAAGSLSQAFALSSAGMLTTQGLAAWIAGTLAGFVSVGAAMSVVAAVSIASTIAFVFPLSRSTNRDHKSPPSTGDAYRHAGGKAPHAIAGGLA